MVEGERYAEQGGAVGFPVGEARLPLRNLLLGDAGFLFGVGNRQITRTCVISLPSLPDIFLPPSDELFLLVHLAFDGIFKQRPINP